MLYLTTYTFRSPITEESQKRFLALFAKWTVPAGIDRKAHYGHVDGSGGFIISDCDSTEIMLQSVAPWAPWLEMRIVPILEVTKAVPVMLAAYGWRDSVGK